MSQGWPLVGSALKKARRLALESNDLPAQHLSAERRFFIFFVFIGAAMLGRLVGLFQLVGLALAAAVLSACQGAGESVPPPAVAPQAPSGPDHITFSAPLAWGGEARCTGGGCKLVLVEHEEGQLVLHEFKGRRTVELDRKPLAYHPDSAKWLTDGWVVAAVERGQSLDFFTVDGAQLAKHTQVVVPFAPRDVVVLANDGNNATLLATPYSGKHVAVVQWQLGSKEGQVTPVNWCEAPWHPALVKRAPKGAGAGVVTSCLDDKKLLYVSAKDWTATPTELARFDRVARQARPSTSGKWVYVALEIGPQNARVDMDTGEVQHLDAERAGAVSVAALSDDMVIWGEANSVYLQRFDAAGKVLETRWLRPSGFPTELQLIDLDGDGERDLLILNSSGQLADVFYGPLWDRALNKL